jgi:hypothetical protein
MFNPRVFLIYRFLFFTYSLKRSKTCIGGFIIYAASVRPSSTACVNQKSIAESSQVTMVAGVVVAAASPLPAEPLSPVHHTLDAAEVDSEILSGDGFEALPSSHTTDMSASHTWAPDAVVPACVTAAPASASAAPASPSVLVFFLL